MEPTLAPIAGRLVGGMLMPQHESGDACEFSARGRFDVPNHWARLSRFGSEVLSINVHAGKVCTLTLDTGRWRSIAVILAAGCSSRALAHPLGLKLPIQPVKGYSAYARTETTRSGADHPAAGSGTAHCPPPVSAIDCGWPGWQISTDTTVPSARSVWLFCWIRPASCCRSWPTRFAQTAPKPGPGCVR